VEQPGAAVPSLRHAQRGSGGTTGAVTLCGNARNLELQPELAQLDWNLSHLAGGALVVGRELAEQDRIQKLLEA
jgi:hypothetical protein